MTRPLNFGRAGILAIFCTQSNDFAIGSPIVNALYHHAHPEYAAYLYLMAPLSLAILNPIGYIFLELSSVQKASLVQVGYKGHSCFHQTFSIKNVAFLTG